MADAVYSFKQYPAKAGRGCGRPFVVGYTGMGNKESKVGAAAGMVRIPDSRFPIPAQPRPRLWLVPTEVADR